MRVLSGGKCIVRACAPRTTVCILLQFGLLSCLPTSAPCLLQRRCSFTAPPGPRLLFSDSRLPGCHCRMLPRSGLCKPETAMPTLMVREEYWGKKQAGTWERELGLRESKITPEGIVCHPCAHLAWSLCQSADSSQEELPSFGAMPQPPAVVDFKRLNSVQRTVALHVDWNRVMQLATDLAEDGGDGRITAVRWSSTADTSPQLQVADTKSMELALAHALLDRSVFVDIVPEMEEEAAVRLDLSKIPPINGGVPRSEGSLSSSNDWTPAMREGWTEMEEHGKVVIGMIDPSVVAHSRDNETPCWPKVWRFARKMRENQDQVWTGPCGFGEVPLKWDASLHRWNRNAHAAAACAEKVAGNRHRLLSALVAGSVYVRNRSTQKRDWALARYKTAFAEDESRIEFGGRTGLTWGGGETGVPFLARCRSQQVVEWGVREGEDGQELKFATKIVSFKSAPEA